MQVGIYDSICRRIYSDTSIGQIALGGTESTVIRVARGLNAFVLQQGRAQKDGRYLPFHEKLDLTHVITLREPEAALELCDRIPNAKHFLWLHDLCGLRYERGKQLQYYSVQLAKKNIRIVCVSNYHAAQVRATIRSAGCRDVHVRTIYNPVDVEPFKSVIRDPDKLIYFSSPHKGLAHAIRVFRYIKYRIPKMKLYIANPGYNPDLLVFEDGIVNLGSIDQKELTKHVQSSMCTFFPNFGYPETFGLVMAESNALGTPVLAHPIGAAAEVLGNNGQLIPIPWKDIWAERVFRILLRDKCVGSEQLSNMGLFRSYIDRLCQWREGRPPLVGERNDFRPQFVFEEWVNCLTE